MYFSINAVQHLCEDCEERRNETKIAKWEGLKPRNLCYNFKAMGSMSQKLYYSEVQCRKTKLKYYFETNKSVWNCYCS